MAKNRKVYRVLDFKLKPNDTTGMMEYSIQMCQMLGMQYDDKNKTYLLEFSRLDEIDTSEFDDLQKRWLESLKNFIKKR